MYSASPLAIRNSVNFLKKLMRMNVMRQFVNPACADPRILQVQDVGGQTETQSKTLVIPIPSAGLAKVPATLLSLMNVGSCHVVNPLAPTGGRMQKVLKGAMLNNDHSRACSFIATAYRMPSGRLLKAQIEGTYISYSSRPASAESGKCAYSEIVSFSDLKSCSASAA